MFTKRAAVLARRITLSHTYSQSRLLQSDPNVSYLHNPGCEPLTIATLGDVLAESANKYPNRIAIRSIHEDLTLTYEELLTQADSLGCTLRANGFNKGDRLGIWTHNMAGWIVSVLAAARVGLISVFINPVYEKSELSFCLKKTGMKGLVIGNSIKNRDYYNSLKHLIPELDGSKPGALVSEQFPELTTIISLEKSKLNGVFTFNTLLGNNTNQVSKYGSEIKPEDGSIIHFTSGTTGDPKAALDSHLGVVNNTYFIGRRNGYDEDNQKICVQVPLFHALGSVVTTLAALRHGATLVLASPIYNIPANINALLAEKCTAVTGTPTMYVDMISQIREHGDLPLRLRMALAAGAPCSPQLIRDMNKYLKADSVLALYGMTETTASVFQSKPGDDIDIVADTVGYIQDHVEVKVVDEDGETVPFGGAGELLVRGYNTMICYWDEPEKTKNTLTEDGWLSTGDKFTVSEDGYGRVVGRLKDIIVRGGENIAPKEIEDLLNTHPDVVESQVVGIADERLGEELCAVLRTRDGATVTLDDVRKFCSGHIARFKIPRVLKIADDFPKTASGKIQKFKLRDLIESGKL
ncbi:PREDICTED: acyl-CoA synthetase family member 2, mitochondrial [Papilio polytes]|uniref:acyl-CoA synthetase family member 2, mitochondrial n=1 Tax=Papilio polytes TaxID=76194 RepID=UPI000675F518|nr:PREDICTED: acyl-CoA synthetase family member 2, mitochondrial [Papilio polytes]